MGRRLSGFLWRHPRAQLGLLLSGPIGWLLVAYLGSLAVLFVASLWQLDDFSGEIVHKTGFQNFQELGGDAGLPDDRRRGRWRSPRR